MSWQETELRIHRLLEIASGEPRPWSLRDDGRNIGIVDANDKTVAVISHYKINYESLLVESVGLLEEALKEIGRLRVTNGDPEATEAALRRAEFWEKAARM